MSVFSLQSCLCSVLTGTQAQTVAPAWKTGIQLKSLKPHTLHFKQSVVWPRDPEKFSSAHEER